MRWDKDYTPYDYWLRLSGSITSDKNNIFARIVNYFCSYKKMGDPEIHSEPVNLFVYGTLKRGFQWNQKYLSFRVGGNFVSKAETKEAMPLVVGDCGVPYVLGDQLADEDAKCIVGELWTVGTSCLQNLDDYEGVSKGYYSRKRITITWHDEYSGRKESDAFIYVLNDSSPELRCQPKLEEYTLDIHKSQYHATQHIQVKQKSYYAAASTWGKAQKVFDESLYKST